MAKSDLVSESITRKEFKYSKDGVSLSFSLRVDNSSELRPFRECLEKALVDVINQISEMKN